MLIAGDNDLMSVILDYYTNAAVFLSQRTELYYGHAGVWTTEVRVALPLGTSCASHCASLSALCVLGNSPAPCAPRSARPLTMCFPAQLSLPSRARATSGVKLSRRPPAPARDPLHRRTTSRARMTSQTTAAARAPGGPCR